MDQAQAVLNVADKQERRKHPRYKCALPVEIRLPGISYPSQGQTIDVSLSGCYVSSRFNMAVGSQFDLRLWVGDKGLATKAVVRTSDPGVGNGIEFVSLSEEDLQVLSAYFERLEHSPQPSGEPSIKDLLIF